METARQGARMSRTLVLRTSAVATCLTAALALPAFAHAATTPQCRASVARVTGGSTQELLSEPIRANDATGPCTPQSSQALKPADVGDIHLNAATAITD